MGESWFEGVSDTVSRYARKAVLAAGIVGMIGIGSCERQQEYSEKAEHVYGVERDVLVQEIQDGISSRDHVDRVGTEYDESFDPSLFTEQELVELDAIMDGLEDAEVLQGIGELVRKDLQEGEVSLYGVKSLLNDRSDVDSTGVYTRHALLGSFRVEADRTEIGGLLHDFGDGLVVRPYQPAMPFSDLAYIPSAVMRDALNADSKFGGGLGGEEYSDGFTRPVEEGSTIHNVYTDDALAWFHIHAVKEEGNPSGAGPSQGDLEASGLFQEPGVVFSYIGTDENGGIVVNVDHYRAIDYDQVQRFGVDYDNIDVVDLGNYATGVELDG